MIDDPQGHDRLTDSEPGKDERADLVSAARRRALKIGMGSLPVILTLASRPLYSQNPNPCASITMSAASSRGIQMEPDCVLEPPLEP